MKGSLGRPTQYSGRMNIRYSKNTPCPSCNCTDKTMGGILLIRKGEYGEFLGCSNYPKCKYTTSRIKN